MRASNGHIVASSISGNCDKFQEIYSYVMHNIHEKAYLRNERVWGPKNTKFGFAVKKCSNTYSFCRLNFKISAENPLFLEIIDEKCSAVIDGNLHMVIPIVRA